MFLSAMSRSIGGVLAVAESFVGRTVSLRLCSMASRFAAWLSLRAAVGAATASALADRIGRFEAVDGWFNGDFELRETFDLF